MPAGRVPEEFLVLSALCLSREVYNEILHPDFFSLLPQNDFILFSLFP